MFGVSEKRTAVRGVIFLRNSRSFLAMFDPISRETQGNFSRNFFCASCFAKMEGLKRHFFGSGLHSTCEFVTKIHNYLIKRHFLGQNILHCYKFTLILHRIKN